MGLSCGTTKADVKSTHITYCMHTYIYIFIVKYIYIDSYTIIVIYIYYVCASFRTDTTDLSWIIYISIYAYGVHNTYIYTDIRTYVRTYIPPYTHTSIHPSIHPCIHTYIQTDRPTYLPTYVRTYVHTYIYICIMYVQTPWCSIATLSVCQLVTVMGFCDAFWGGDDSSFGYLNRRGYPGFAQDAVDRMGHLWHRRWRSEVDTVWWAYDVPSGKLT